MQGCTKCEMSFGNIFSKRKWFFLFFRHFFLLLLLLRGGFLRAAALLCLQCREKGDARIAVAAASMPWLDGPPARGEISPRFPVSAAAPSLIH